MSVLLVKTKCQARISKLGTSGGSEITHHIVLGSGSDPKGVAIGIPVLVRYGHLYRGGGSQIDLTLDAYRR